MRGEQAFHRELGQAFSKIGGVGALRAVLGTPVLSGTVLITETRESEDFLSGVTLSSFCSTVLQALLFFSLFLALPSPALQLLDKTGVCCPIPVSSVRLALAPASLTNNHPFGGPRLATSRITSALTIIK